MFPDSLFVVKQPSSHIRTTMAIRTEKVLHKVKIVSLLVTPAILIALIGAILWALVAPGVAIICHSARSCRTFPTEYIHDFDALALWVLISLLMGIALGVSYYQFSSRRGTKMVVALGGISLGTCIVSSYCAKIFVWERLKLQGTSRIKTIVPTPGMEEFYPIASHSQSVGHLDLTLLFLHYFPMLGLPIFALFSYGILALMSTDPQLGRP